MDLSLLAHFVSINTGFWGRLAGRHRPNHQKPKRGVLERPSASANGIAGAFAAVLDPSAAADASNVGIRSASPVGQ